MEQRKLFCRCGQPLPRRAAQCRRCSQGEWYSRRRFGSNRETVLERDGRRCRACGAGTIPLHVHHRCPGRHEAELLLTVCASCHARIHHLLTNRRWLASPLFEFWLEQHPDSSIQLQLALEPTA
jgi:5-methylcytosine-specific restriction endonuclease McrA